MQELSVGAVVTIGRKVFRIAAPLGMGSYGIVWNAVGHDGREVAIKEILCRGSADLVHAEFEGDLLNNLGKLRRECKDVSSVDNRPQSSRCSNGLEEMQTPACASNAEANAADHRVPELVAQETHQIGEQEWKVRLAMSRLPGVPLMLILEQQKAEWQKGGAASRNIQPASSSARLLAEPCLLAQELVAQLAPTLERLSVHAYHRDVNPRNILIDTCSSPAPSYSLVDFGMAVDSPSWNDEGNGSWAWLEVGGDCRYWPISAWVMFLHGPQELHPGSFLVSEYKDMLDLHALGITALQVLMEMSPKLIECHHLVPSDGSDPVFAEMQELQAIWDKYWEDATDFWGCLIDCFSNNGDWNALKAACISHGVQDVMSADLVALQKALAKALDACKEAPRDENLISLEALLRAVYAMVSTGHQDPMPSWRRVHAALNMEPDVNTGEHNGDAH